MLFGVLILTMLSCSSSQREQIVIYAASSLQYTIEDAHKNVQDKMSNTDVLFQFAGSQTLATQIEHGAPADLFLSAHPDLMKQLQEKKMVAEQPMYFGSNELVVIQSPKFSQIQSFEDLPQAESIVLGHEASPIGIYTEVSLQKMSLEWQESLKSKILSRESNVALLRNQVFLGEVHCAIVYRTDAVSTELPILEIPKKLQPQIIYQLAYIQKKSNEIHPQSRRWVDFFMSEHNLSLQK